MPELEFRAVFHLVLHVIVPLAVARLFWPKEWKRAALWMLAAGVIDLDHLLADPVYAPGRCSLGFHPLHTWPAIAVYAGLSVPKKTRWFGVGLLVHIALDGLDQQAWDAAAQSSKAVFLHAIQAFTAEELSPA